MCWHFITSRFFRAALLVVCFLLLLEIRLAAAPLVAVPTNYIPGTLAYHVLTNSLASTNGFNPASGLCLQETLPGYQWNTRLWLYKFPEITSINSGLGSGAGGQSPGTYGMQLITRRHAIQAHHVSWANPVGTPIAFTDKRGVVFTNVVQSMTNSGFDINVVQFRDEFPRQFVPFPLLPTNYAQYLAPVTNGQTATVRLPVIAGTYDRHLYFMTLLGVRNDPFGGLRTNATFGAITFDGGMAGGDGHWLTNQIGLGWGQTEAPYFIKRGDSSRPVMMLVGSHLVLLSSIYTFGMAPDYASAAPAIQAAIDALTEADGGTDGQYRIKILDLSSFPLPP
jgi:hypothetical protein